MTRKQELQQQADAWMEVNKQLISAPSCHLSQRPYDGRDEVKGQNPASQGRDNTKTTGRLFHTILGDGWDNLPWRFASHKLKWSDADERWSFGSERPWTFSQSRGTKRVTTKAESIRIGRRIVTDMPKATMERGYYPTPICDYHLPAEPTGDWRDGVNARRQALKEASQGGLKPKTVVLGQHVPAHLSIQKRTEYSKTQKWNREVCSFGDLFTSDQLDEMNPEDMFEDTRQIELIAMDDLRSLLRSYVTEKEMEALEQRAAGVAVTDRHCLKRAQRKAQEAVCHFL